MRFVVINYDNSSSMNFLLLQIFIRYLAPGFFQASAAAVDSFVVVMMPSLVLSLLPSGVTAVLLSDVRSCVAVFDVLLSSDLKNGSQNLVLTHFPRSTFIPPLSGPHRFRCISIASLTSLSNLLFSRVIVLASSHLTPSHSLLCPAAPDLSHADFLAYSLCSEILDRICFLVWPMYGLCGCLVHRIL